MEVRFRVTRVRVAIVAAFIVAAVAASVAWAASPGDGGVILGCYDSGGNVKVVAALPCPKGYTALQWNVQGVKGDQGIQGIQGEKGDKGDKGDQGIQGLKGDQGIQGVQGPKGDKGDPGAGLSGYEIVTAQTSTGLFSTNAVDATCPSGKTVIGGGGRTGLAEDGATGNILMSHPQDNGWHVRAYNSGPFTTMYITAYAICANLG